MGYILADMEGMPGERKERVDRVSKSFEPAPSGLVNPDYHYRVVLAVEGDNGAPAERKVMIPHGVIELSDEDLDNPTAKNDEILAAIRRIEGTPAVQDQVDDNAREIIPGFENIETIVRNYLSYQDAAISDDVKRDALEHSLREGNARKYAEALLRLAREKGGPAILEKQRELQAKMLETIHRLGMPDASVYGNSITWSLWDIGKQYHFFTHQEENDPRYAVGHPLESEEKAQEIVDRHVGWEFYGFSRSPSGTDAVRALRHDRRFVRALPLLNKEPKPASNSLASNELALLGMYLREATASSVQDPDDQLSRPQDDHAPDDRLASSVSSVASEPSATRALAIEKKAMKPRRFIPLWMLPFLAPFAAAAGMAWLQYKTLQAHWWASGKIYGEKGGSGHEKKEKKQEKKDDHGGDHGGGHGHH